MRALIPASLPPGSYALSNLSSAEDQFKSKMIAQFKSKIIADQFKTKIIADQFKTKMIAQDQ